MSNKQYYLGTLMVSDEYISEDVNVLYSTAKDPVKVLDLIAKHSYSDGSDESPVKEDDWWVFADGYMTKVHRYHSIKKSTYEDLSGCKTYLEENFPDDANKIWEYILTLGVEAKLSGYEDLQGKIYTDNNHS
ncbi:MAG: hypothetical protein CML19_11595 [Pusillimonas sp.]|nr:hypothetical protein [Pusillimonas sp.]|tara:strand:- start:189 stop:584 length:396 start_codon:yes stop_codon:yes gene_type:complete